jgi:ribonuclease PH
MAYLPGERPLLYPWQNESKITESISRAPARGFSTSTDVCGPGSHYIEVGSGPDATKVIATVRGPRQQPINRSAFEVDVSYAPFAVLQIPNFPDLSKEIAAYVKEAVESSLCLELYPQTAVTIYIKILQCGSSIHTILPVAITASSLACKQAGISIKDVVVGVSVAVSESGEYIINPSDDIATSQPCATIAMWKDNHQISFLHITGKLVGGEDTIDSIVNMADSAITEISNSIV